MPRVHADPASCDGCGLCVEVCPNLVLDLEERRVIVLDPDALLGAKGRQLCHVCPPQSRLCLDCVACVRNCPS